MNANEDAAMQEIRDTRKRLMEQCGNDPKRFFELLRERQKELVDSGRFKLVRYEPIATE